MACPDARLLNQVHEVCGIDISSLNSHSTRGQIPLRLTTWQHSVLSEPEQLYSIDLEAEPSDEGAWLQDFRVTEDGVVDGVVAWFDMDLGADVSLSTHPSRRSHWMQAFMCFDAPVEVRAGSTLTVSFAVEDDVRLLAQPADPWDSPGIGAAEIDRDGIDEQAGVPARLMTTHAS